MTNGRYRVVINGFTVQSETWDDALNWDGKHDEVYVAAAVQAWNSTGKAIYSNVATSPVMGDTWQLNGRVKAGTASDRGGLVTGDTFPTTTPWMRTQALDDARNYPPMKIWEGDLIAGESMVTIAPGLNEWDPGSSALQSWLQWASMASSTLGPQIKTLIAAGKTASLVIDAIALGIDVLANMDKAGLFGSSADRPIGMVASAADPRKFVYNPQILILTAENAEYIINNQPSGKGAGVLELGLVDDPYLRGNYRLYVQVERVNELPDQIDPNAEYEITAKHSGRVLDAAGTGTINGTPLIQWDWWGGDNQKWRLSPVGDGTFWIQGVGSGRAIDCDQMGSVNGAKVQLWDWAGSANQRWRLVPVEFGFYKIESAASQRVLDVSGQSPSNGAEVIVWDWWGGDNQKWRLTKRS